MKRKLEKLSAAERMQINAAHKAHEGSRLLALFGALGALPAGALVLGAESAPGAPLFCIALVALFAAYMFWGYTDAAYQADSLGYLEGEDIKDLHQTALRWQRASFGYGMVAISCTLAGFAAVYSEIRVPISVSGGFLMMIPLTAGAAYHVVQASTDRNNLIFRVRAAGEKLAAEWENDCR